MFCCKLPQWILAGHKAVTRECVIGGFQKAGLLAAWDMSVQSAAWKRRAELFKNVDDMVDDPDVAKPSKKAGAAGNAPAAAGNEDVFVVSPLRG